MCANEVWKQHIYQQLFETSKKDKKSNGTFLHYINYKDIVEWGIQMIRKRAEGKCLSKYKALKIKQLCLVNSGGTPSRSNKEYYQGNIPWIKTGEVLNNFISDTEEHITNAAILNSSAKIYPKGSLIIAMYGQGDTRGRSAKLGVDAATNQACAVLHHINEDLILTDYLGQPIISVERFIDEYNSRNASLADLMRRLGICEELGSGLDKAVAVIELFQLPPLRFTVQEARTTITLFAYRKYADLDRQERIYACYQHACLKYVTNDKMTNLTLRERLGIDKQNYPMASRIIKDTLLGR